MKTNLTLLENYFYKKKIFYAAKIQFLQQRKSQQFQQQ